MSLGLALQNIKIFYQLQKNILFFTQRYFFFFGNHFAVWIEERHLILGIPSCFSNENFSVFAQHSLRKESERIGESVIFLFSPSLFPLSFFLFLILSFFITQLRLTITIKYSWFQGQIYFSGILKSGYCKIDMNDVLMQQRLLFFTTLNICC